jgi:hypothetical protein
LANQGRSTLVLRIPWAIVCDGGRLRCRGHVDGSLRTRADRLGSVSGFTQTFLQTARFLVYDYLIVVAGFDAMSFAALRGDPQVSHTAPGGVNCPHQVQGTVPSPASILTPVGQPRSNRPKPGPLG